METSRRNAEPDQVEIARLDVLARFDAVGRHAEPVFDRIAELAAELSQTPMALISIVGKHRPWIKARIGIEPEHTGQAEAFCTYAVLHDDVLVVPDADRDDRLQLDQATAETGGLRFFAGAPIVSVDGHRLGTLCVMDRAPRKRFSKRERAALRSLARLVMAQMDLAKDEVARETVIGFAEATGLALMSVDTSGRISFVNPSAAVLFGYSTTEMLGETLDLIIPDRMRGAHHAGLARVVETGESKLTGKTVELVARKRDGSEFPIELSISIWRNESGMRMGAIIKDISERRARDARLLGLANHDTLTGLLNRGRFIDRLREMFAAQQTATVLLIDLDGFKEVNDSLGHAVGDTLLQTIAIRLPLALADDAVVARLGGDEFAILLPGTGDALNAEAVANAVIYALEAPFELDGHIFQLTASIGFALGPNHGVDAEELIASADFALYRAKQAGGRSSRIFEPAMRNASVARRAMQDELLHALQRQELLLYYQPQVSLADGRLVGLEALIRWQHPERGLLLPHAFLPALETSSTALRIGGWVIDEACRQLARWDQAGLPCVRVAVNLFQGQLRSGTLVRFVTESLARHGVDPALLEIELTETIALHSEDYSFAAIQELRDLGVGIAFDDFGTGYASLSTLKRFPLTTLKIDQGFVRDMLVNSQDASIIRAILTIGHELGLEIVAEGIETADQETALRAMGCVIGQGYRYGKPMPPDDAATLLRGQSMRLAAAGRGMRD